jgi:hypothetical protein
MAPLFRLVVMGGMDSGLWPSPFGRAARVGRPTSSGADVPPSVLRLQQKGRHKGALFICLVVMGGIEPPTYGL